MGGGGGTDSCVAPAGAVCIGAAGGTVAGPQGASLVIPPGALASSQAIQITQDATGAPASPAGTSAAGGVWQVLPHGLQFAQTATLSLPFDSAAMAQAGSAGQLPWVYKAQPGGVYALQNAVTAGAAGFVQVGLTSLSYVTLRTNKAPVALLTLPSGSAIAGQVLSFSAASSTDAEGRIVSYQWRFGDEAAGAAALTTTSPSATHSYSAPGIYTVTLVVTDELGKQHSAAATLQVIAANAAPVARVTGPNSGLTDQNLIFSAATSSDVDGTITTYSFSYSDGLFASSGSSPTAQRSFASPGSYIVTLTVTDNQGASHASSYGITISAAPPPNVAPTAVLTAPAGNAIAGQTLAFSGSASTDSDGTIASYAWNFGDPASGSANTASGASANHSFASPGTYGVSLTVTDNQGATHVAATSIVVIAANLAPLAQLASNIAPASIITGQEIILNPAASTDSDGTITSYLLSLADGASSTVSTTAQPTTTIYSFATPGLRTVTLQVTDNQGATNSYALSISVQSYSATGALNDTGIDWCSENITTPSIWVNNAVCSAVAWGTNLWGTMQDAYFGRDAQARAGTLTKVGTGMAGFDFTRIGASGQPLSIQNATYSATGNEAAGTRWECIRDNNTGLIWEVKRMNDPTHLRHYTATFTWYNTDTANNGGIPGTETGGSCTGVADSTKCNTSAYRTATNTLPSSQAMCGFRDWRMPSKDELVSITHLGRNQPAIDSNHFPDVNLPAPVCGITWSSSPILGYPGGAWFVYFGYGYDGYVDESDAFAVRLVRSGQ